MSGHASKSQLDEIFADFAHPFPGPDRPILQLITLRSLSLYLSRILGGECGDLLSKRSPGLSQVLRLWEEHGKTFFWEPLLGQLRELSTNADNDIEFGYPTLVEAGLRAHFDGVSGSWAFRFPMPTRLRLGAWLFPSVVAGRVDADIVNGMSLNFKQADGSDQDLLFYRDSIVGTWRCNNASSCPVRLPTVAWRDSETVLLPDCAIDQRFLPNLPRARFVKASESTLVIERIRRAADLVQNYCADYVDWIGAGVACLAPFNSPHQSSGSYPSSPGLVVMSNDPRPAALAEMLVHEASHQYFFMITLLGPIDDGSDSEEYYSPLVGRSRPIEKLLLSFHALGNMILVLRACMASGGEEAEYCRERLAVITAQAQTAEDALQKTRSLTQLGKSLWSPLAQLLAQTAG